MVFWQPQLRPDVLADDASIQQYAQGRIGRAVRRAPALRFIALDESSNASPWLIVLSGQPRAFDAPMAADVAEWVAGRAGIVPMSQLVGVWQRRGTAEYAEHELAWVRLLDDALREVGYPARAWLLSHSRGVRWIAWDDLLPPRR